MTYNPNVNDRQKDSLVEYPSGSELPARRVYIVNESGEKVPVELGPPHGLQVGGLVTEVTLNATTWTPLPTTALTARNAISVQNRSGIEIKINYDSGVAGYVGIVIPTNGERYYDISDSIILYGKSFSGTPTINIEELA